MLLSDFDYILPPELIATEPVANRDDSKLVEFNKGKICEYVFSEIINLFKAGDVLVLNNTKVIPAKITGKCLEKNVEVNLIKKTDNNLWLALAKPAKKLKLGEYFEISENFKAKIIGKQISGEVALKFDYSEAEFLSKLKKYGTVPLPPYIEKQRTTKKIDEERYQTIFADESKQNSVAAPTAGLHFTPEILESLQEKGIKIANVTLNVGAGTFFPVRVDNILEHQMHSEFIELTEKNADIINSAKKSGGRVISVGTTSLRVLESCYNDLGEVSATTKETEIFIYPGYNFKIVDILLTNFHLPKSTLFMLVSAFIGLEEAKSLYEFCIDKKYRFFSYGDASLLYLKNC